MRERSPHFLLFSDVTGDSYRCDRWRFVLQSVGGKRYFAAEDAEPGIRPSRLELLAVVRGLEALDQPSRVTLVTHSRYVCRGIRRGLSQWRARRWRWEHFGELVPIRDHDLWQRVDRAMRFHEVDCCPWIDQAATEMARAQAVASCADAAWEAAQEANPETTPAAEESPLPADLAACTAHEPVAAGRQADAGAREASPLTRRPAANPGSLAAFFDQLRQNALACFSNLTRPAFTRAA